MLECRFAGGKIAHMAHRPLNVVFKCTPAQLATAAQKTLGLRNLVATDTIMLNLSATVPGSDAVQDGGANVKRMMRDA
jgi:hypothetical protein